MILHLYSQVNNKLCKIFTVLVKNGGMCCSINNVVNKNKKEKKKSNQENVLSNIFTACKTKDSVNKYLTLFIQEGVVIVWLTWCCLKRPT